MIDPARRRRWAGMIAFAGLTLAALLAGLLPVLPGRIGWPGPDLPLALTLAWMLRRPDQAPLLLVAALAMLGDLLLLRPPGLWAAIIVVASEFARLREHRWRERSFLFEWAKVTALMGAMMLANRFMLSVLMVQDTLSPMPPLGQDLLRLIATAASYPVVVWVSRWLGGLRRLPPGDAELM